MKSLLQRTQNTLQSFVHSNASIFSILAVLAMAAFIFLLCDSAGSFSKVRFFNVYVSELTAIFVGLLILLNGWKFVWAIIKKVWFVFPFLLWAVFVHFIPDLLEAKNLGLGFDRLARHSILFIYPVLWVALGAFFRSQVSFRGWELTVWIVVAIQTYHAIKGYPPKHLSSGPLNAFILPFLLLTAGLLPSWLRERKWLLNSFRLVGAVAWFHPILSTYLVMQRTSFGNFMWNFGAGLFISSRERGISLGKRIAITTFALVTTIALVWFFSTTRVYEAGLDSFLPKELSEKQKEIGDHLAIKILAPFLHTDDFAYRDGKVKVFEARFRKILWLQTIEDWKHKPISGVGFRREVPSYFQNLENKKYPHEEYEFQFLPISGPHNSFLNMLARVGIVGFLLWGFIILVCLKNSYVYLFRFKNITSPLTVIWFLNGMAYSFFNLGFEGPHYAIPMYFVLGALLIHSEKNEEEQLG